MLAVIRFVIHCTAWWTLFLESASGAVKNINRIKSINGFVAYLVVGSIRFLSAHVWNVAAYSSLNVAMESVARLDATTDGGKKRIASITQSSAESGEIAIRGTILLWLCAIGTGLPRQIMSLCLKSKKVVARYAGTMRRSLRNVANGDNFVSTTTMQRGKFAASCVETAILS